MTRKAVLLAVALFAALLLSFRPAACAQTVKVRALPVTFRSSPLPSGIHFFCSVQHDHSACIRDMKTLAAALVSYPSRDLGEWSFLIVSANEWAETVHALRHDPGSPAFSLLEQRVTVFESSLFQASPDRSKEFLEMFGKSGESLLRLAMTHEMSHALCIDRDEPRAEKNGERMRNGAPVRCRPVPSRAANSNASANNASGK